MANTAESTADPLAEIRIRKNALPDSELELHLETAKSHVSKLDDSKNQPQGYAELSREIFREIRYATWCMGRNILNSESQILAGIAVIDQAVLAIQCEYSDEPDKTLDVVDFMQNKGKSLREAHKRFTETLAN